jgi:hypothetical protein
MDLLDKFSSTKIGRRLSPVYRTVRTNYREYFFRHAMKMILADSVCLKSDNKVMSEFIYGWGNEGYSESGEYISDCVGFARKAKGPILECGSGLTTLAVGSIAKQLNNTVWSLEDNEYWGRRIGKYIKQYHIDSVKLDINPLKDYGEFSWYEPPLNIMPGGFALVICDGPVRITKGGRYGLFPIMKKRLKSGCIILLGGAVSEEEHSIVQRWTKEIRSNYEIRGSKHPYFVITLS